MNEKKTHEESQQWTIRYADYTEYARTLTHASPTNTNAINIANAYPGILYCIWYTTLHHIAMTYFFSQLHECASSKSISFCFVPYIPFCSALLSSIPLLPTSHLFKECLFRSNMATKCCMKPKTFLHHFNLPLKWSLKCRFCGCLINSLNYVSLKTFFSTWMIVFVYVLLRFSCPRRSFFLQFPFEDLRLRDDELHSIFTIDCCPFFHLFLHYYLFSAVFVFFIIVFFPECS